MKLISSIDFDNHINTYPPKAKEYLSRIRNILIESAENLGVEKLQEVYRWNEPSYISKNSVTIRIDWKSKYPDHVGIYFQCTSKMIESLRMIHGGVLEFEGNRAIVLSLAKPLPEKIISDCIRFALEYKKYN